MWIQRRHPPLLFLVVVLLSGRCSQGQNDAKVVRNGPCRSVVAAHGLWTMTQCGEGTADSNILYTQNEQVSPIPDPRAGPAQLLPQPQPTPHRVTPLVQDANRRVDFFVGAPIQGFQQGPSQRQQQRRQQQQQQQQNDTQALFQRCFPRPQRCDSHLKYRLLDGSCNNLGSPSWGATLFAFRRLLHPQYEDYLTVPRGSTIFSHIPGAREVSNELYPRDELLDQKHTHLFMSWGQLIAHDVTLTPDRSDMDCCQNPGTPLECFPIAVPPDDHFYLENFPGDTCHNFTRSVPFCLNVPFQQINMRTTYLDADNVYGSDDDSNFELRALRDGLLRENDQFPGLLPFATANFRKPYHSSQRGRSKQQGFVAGDERVNQNQMISTLQTLGMREHNRLALVIKGLRPRWSDDKIFHEARRILVAEWQNILYTEYLPALLGPKILDAAGLVLTGRYTHYDPDLDATMSNEFATAAFRFGHTQIASLVLLFEGHEEVGGHALRDDFENNRDLLQPRGVERMVGGLLHQNAHSGADPVVSFEAANFLFGVQRHEDLFARDVQRNRDHGIPGYVAYRKYCGLSPIRSYHDKPPEFSPKAWAKLQQLYQHPEDIDMYVAGFWERPLKGAEVGPTFACILVDQFQRMLYGDRYFFTHLENPGLFSQDQMIEILHRKLSDYICDTTDIEEVQEYAFFTPGHSNPFIPCSARKPLDVELLLQHP